MVPRLSSGALSFQTALSLISAAAASGCSSQFDNETPGLPEGPVAVALETVASGLAFPLHLTAPSGDPRLFIVEKGGRIRIVQATLIAMNRAFQATLFVRPRLHA